MGVQKKEKGVNDVHKEIGVEVNTDKTTYMFMSRNENAGRSQNIKNGNSSPKMVAHFNYLLPTARNQNSIRDEIKSRLKTDNVCYHSVQNLLSSVCYLKI
jgi:hypothetical protein